MSLDTLKDHEMPRYGYRACQAGPAPLDHTTEYRPDICRGNAMIRIAGDDYPAEVVKSRFLKLDSSHIEYGGRGHPGGLQ